MFGPEAKVQSQEIGRQVAQFCSDLDPQTIGLADVPAVFDELAAMKKLVDGAIVRLTSRYEEAGSWKQAGAKDVEDDVARKTGSSRNAAKRAAKTSRRLKNRPKTDQAVRDGKLSAEQADAVSSGAEASPEDEDSLLDSASKDPLHATREKAARARARADADRDARRLRQHGMRGLRRWTDDDGMCLHLLRSTPEVAAEIDATLKPLIDRAFADARDAGRMESWDAYAADVVADLLRGRRSAPNTPTTATATTAVVIHDGVDIRNVTHLKRQATAHQRTALETRGYQCEVEGCGSTHHLDIDHVTGWTLTRTTRLDDLAWLCKPHHDRKTLERLWLTGPPGRRQLVKPPENADNPDDPPDPGPRQFRLAF